MTLALRFPLPVPRCRPTTCRYCGRTEEEAGHISWRGNCRDHGDYRLIANHRDMLDHRGPFFDHWRRRSLAALGVFAPAEQPTVTPEA